MVPYFDYNATTPLSSAAREAWLRAQDEAWSNASSPHRAGARVKIRLDAARRRLAEFVDSEPERLVFTAGATEAAEAIFQHLARTLPVEQVILVNPTEHPCVLGAARRHVGESRLHWLPVTADGVVTTDALHAALREQPQAGAVVVMAANNETGVLQPWAELAAICREARCAYVCDASQWLGKLPASRLGEVDWCFGAAHKFGGPKSVGFLQVPSGADGFVVRPGTQEAGRRAGTEDFPGIAAMIAALQEAEQTQMLWETERVHWREQFENDVQRRLHGTRIVARGAERLWNTVSLCLPEGENTRWVTRLDKRGFEVSTGSACASGGEAPSHVLAALGFSADEAKRVIRVSSGWTTSREDWQALADALVAVSAEVKPSGAVVRV